MKDTITEYTFTDEMIKHGFSYEGTKALFEYFEQYEQETDHELEFDPIAFRCEYSEYDCFKDIQEDYNDLETIEDLENKTSVIKIPNTERIIIQSY